MDTVVKEGPVVLETVKFGKKTWKRTWMALFQPSSSGIGRVEMRDVKDGILGLGGAAGMRKVEKRVIRLSECLSVAAAPGESCPADLAAFHVNTARRTYTIASHDALEWVHVLSELAFSVNSGAARDEFGSLEDNVLYSALKTDQYQVVVQQTEAAVRCGLLGSYLLSPGEDGLSLLDPRKTDTVCRWPYRFLRRYGRVKEGFSIEAGRRCDSGEGRFVFLAQEAVEICRAVEEAVARQSALSQEPERPSAGAGAAAHDRSRGAAGTELYSTITAIPAPKAQSRPSVRHWSTGSASPSGEEESLLYSKLSTPGQDRRPQHVTSTEIPVDFKQVLSNVLFRDMARTQPLPSSETTHFNRTIYQNHTED
ncbi:docking protein 3 [Denticeps clupeoides]|uniref:docking protein 3 n=1 Tax=Denticeps clupeoides TaxID=299321 RepID=UPI0010A2B05B|nr:docking protein 3 [Denticeps clupeoides]